MLSYLTKTHIPRMVQQLKTTKPMGQYHTNLLSCLYSPCLCLFQYVYLCFTSKWTITI